jgi:hypothetical protein
VAGRVGAAYSVSDAGTGRTLPTLFAVTFVSFGLALKFMRLTTKFRRLNFGNGKCAHAHGDDCSFLVVTLVCNSWE